LFFGNSANFWLGLQNDYDIENAQTLQPAVYMQINKVNSPGRMATEFA
jgi:plasmid maintenance system antidote protein VapI